MIPVLFKKNEQQFRTYGLGEITDIINPKVTRERNGQYLLYFQYPQNAEFSDVFEEDMRIKSDAGVRTKWQTFEISRVIRKEGQLIEVFAKHISQSLLKDALNPSVSVRSSNAQQALRTWNSNRIGDEEFDVWSDISTTSSTSWDIRDVSNAFEALAGVQGSILDVWGGEYEFDNKMIRLHKEMGRKSPVPLEYGRNITGLEQDQQEDNVYTSVYPFATYTPEGSNEPKTVTLPEYYIDGKYLEMHNKRKIQVVDFSGEYDIDNPPTVSSLRTLAKQYLEANEIGLPHENLKVEYIDLSKTLDYQDFKTMEEVELNDRLPIFYPKFGITNENAKVVVINYDPVKEENISIELGVIGQTFKTITTGGIDSRLDRVEKQQTETTKYIVNNKGNRIWFETPDENMEHKIGDTWFEKNGPYDRIRVWNGNQWEVIIDTEDVDKNAKAIESAQQDITEAKQTADEAVEQINTAVANAGFTSLDETISSVQTISNQAQINAGTAIDNALEAIQQASQAVDNTGSLNIRVDEVENTLSVKADKQTVDDLTGVVDMHALDIRANAEGLALKANQDTVDTLARTVQSLGTEFDIVAGQVSSRVWNTDIESAIDGIEVGGRNLLRNSGEFEDISGWSRGTIVNKNGFKSIEATGTIFNRHNPKIESNTNYVYSAWLMSSKDFRSSEISSSTPLHSQWRDGKGGGNYSGYEYRRLLTSEYPDIIPANTWFKVSVLVKTKEDISENADMTAYIYGTSFVDSIYWVRNFKLEKGTKATDWTPAPEDTDAKISHIETEFTQKYDSITSTVSDIDGRVTAQTQEIDRITRTIQEVTEDVEGNTTKINQTVSTVDKHTQTIANIETDLDGKVETSEYNTLVSTVDSTIRRIGDAEGNITQVEESIEGVQTIVAGKADKKVVEDLEGEMIEITTAHSTAISQTQKSISNVITRVDDIDGEIVETQTRIDLIDENINLRLVKKDEIITQINLSEENILLQANKIQALGDVVVDGKLTITDEFIAPNAQIDGAKIADATINHAKIVSVDASSITTGTLRSITIEGVTAYLDKGYIGNWNMRKTMLSGQNPDGTYSIFKANGAMLAASVPREDGNTEGATLQIFTSGEIRTNRNKIMRISMYEDELRFYANNETLRGVITGAYDSLDINTPGNRIRLMAGTVIDGYLRPNGDADSRFRIGDTTNRWYRLYATQSTYVSSDARYKDNIREIPSGLLKEFAKLEPKAYEMDKKTHIGYIAQDVERALYKYAVKEAGFEKAREHMEQFDMLIKDESYMGLVYAELAVLKDYEQQLQIKELENRIKELENAS